MTPGGVEQVVLADDLAGVLQERRQYRVGLGFDRYGDARALNTMRARLDDDVVALVDPATVWLGLGHDLA
jgi:hypothetical protein